MTTTLDPLAHTEIPLSRAVATARYLLGRGLRRHETIDALVSELDISVADAFEATDTAMSDRGNALTAAHA